MSELTKAVTDDTFKQDVLAAPGPVLVDFWAEWCGPCRMVGPILDDIAREYEGKLTIAKVNIDENPMTPNEYAVRGIPTMPVQGRQAAGHQGGRHAEGRAEGLDCGADRVAPVNPRCRRACRGEAARGHRAALLNAMPRQAARYRHPAAKPRGWDLAGPLAEPRAARPCR